MHLFHIKLFLNIWKKLLEVYPGAAQIFKMENFAAIFTGSYPLIIVAKLSILDVCEGPCYASGFSKTLRSILGDHSFSVLAKFSENLRFLPSCTYVCVSRVKMLVFGKFWWKSCGLILPIHRYFQALLATNAIWGEDWVSRKVRKRIKDNWGSGEELGRFSLRFDLKSPNCGSKKYTK